MDHVRQGILDFGSTGAGKTTSSGRTISEALLRQAFGGLVLTTKPGEVQEWVRLCMTCGREDEFSLVRLKGPLRINILEYEAHRPGAGSLVTENLVGFLRTLITLIQNRHDRRVSEEFWRDAGDQLLRNSFKPFLMAKAPLKLDTLASFICNAPTEALKSPEAWRTISVFGEYMVMAEKNIVSLADQEEFDRLRDYWLRAYPTLPANTRNCVTFAFGAMIDVLRTRDVYELLCSDIAWECSSRRCP